MRLYTNGCSFVWGDELEDRGNEAFPFLLKDRLGCELINESRRGSSNQRILRTTLARKFEKDTFVIIGWSSIYRYEYHVDGIPYQTGPRDGAKFRVIKDLEEEWFIVNFLNQVLALQNHLKYHNIPFFFFLSFTGASIDGGLFDLVDKETFPSLFNNDLVFRDYCINNGALMTKGFNGHPTKESHQVWADYLYENSNITK